MADIPIPTQDAETEAHEFVQNSTKVRNSWSDPNWSGGEFLEWFIRECCKLLQIKKTQTTAFHPKPNGILEGQSLWDMFAFILQGTKGIGING
jgi:hypothetical protein